MQLHLPFDLFYQSLEEGKVYFFDRNAQIGVPDHRHVCVTKTKKDEVVFVATTSNDVRTNRMIELGLIDSSTIVYVPKDGDCFTMNTFINCNQVWTYSEDELKAEYESRTIRYRGEVTEDKHLQILNGIHSSNQVDEEIKDIIPKDR